MTDANDLPRAKLLVDVILVRYEAGVYEVRIPEFGDLVVKMPSDRLLHLMANPPGGG